MPAVTQGGYLRRLCLIPDQGLLLASVVLHLGAALFLGHAYDTRIFMATGYLTGTGQNPYVAQDLREVFHNPAFHEMTSVGYLPPWPLALGLLYRATYAIVPNLLVYNLAHKLPIIAANIALAYLVASLLQRLGAPRAVARRAWAILLFSPFLLYFTSAWGQFDSIVALLGLEALILLHDRKWMGSAVLLALAIAFKPTPLPLLPMALILLAEDSLKPALRYAGVFAASWLLFCIVPFIGLGWDPTPILTNWNAHFTVGGGMSFMTFYELLQDRYQLPGNWWLLGLAWLPALGAGLLAFRGGDRGMAALLKKSLGLVLIFFLTRTWLSEPNIALILPWVLILTSLGELSGLALAAVWCLPLIFTFFNASPPQLLFPAFPQAMVELLRLADEFRTPRLIARILVVIPWQIAGWWIVVTCLNHIRSASHPFNGNRPASAV
jgi:hypothetical protein